MLHGVSLCFRVPCFRESPQLCSVSLLPLLPLLLLLLLLLRRACRCIVTCGLMNITNGARVVRGQAQRREAIFAALTVGIHGCPQRLAPHATAAAGLQEWLSVEELPELVAELDTPMRCTV